MLDYLILSEHVLIARLGYLTPSEHDVQIAMEGYLTPSVNDVPCADIHVRLPNPK